MAEEAEDVLKEATEIKFAKYNDWQIWRDDTNSEWLVLDDDENTVGDEKRFWTAEMAFEELKRLYWKRERGEEE